jgi:hypothetical protein
MRLSIVALALLAAPLSAGLPQPPIHLSGKVTAGGVLILEGQLVWKYTLANGKSVEVETSLRPTVGGDETVLSYSVLVPVERILEAAASTIPPREVGLQLSRAPVVVTRTATLDGRELRIVSSQNGSSYSINQRTALASFEIVDLGLAFSGEDCCPGDSDGDRLVTLNDFLTTTYWFGNSETALGDANCDLFTNVSDYFMIRQQFGRSCDGSAKSSTSKGIALAKPQSFGAVVALDFIPPSELAEVGKTLEIPVEVDAGKSTLWLAGTFIHYDPTILEFVQGEPGKLFAKGLFTGAPQVVSPGVIAFSSGSDAGLSGSTLLAHLSFRCLASGETVLTVGHSGSTTSRALDSTQSELSLTSSELALKINAANSIVQDWSIIE